jgi:hypothetical protein
MKWIIMIMLAGILVPNIVKFFSMSVGLLGLLPEYLQWVMGDPTVLKDTGTRKRVQNTFTEIFFSMQTHLLNVVILVVLGWNVWHWQIPALWIWLRGIISVVSVVAGVSNVMIARHLFKEYMRVRVTGQVFARLRLNMRHPENLPRTALTIDQTLSVWAGIGLYSLSAVACGSLICVMWY